MWKGRLAEGGREERKEQMDIDGERHNKIT